jgi:tetratricopeptide (TPR) repeat protein
MMFSEQAYEAFLQARLDESIRLAEQGVCEAVMAGDQLEIWRCRCLAAQGLAIQGHCDSAISLLEDYCTRSGLGAHVDAQVLSAKGSLLSQKGCYGESLGILDQAEQFADEAKNPRIMARVLTARATLLFYLGRHSEMHDCVQRIWDIAQGEDDVLLKGCAKAGFGKSLMVHERYGEAIPWLLSAMEALHSIGAAYHAANTKSELGCCHLYLGDLEDALALFSDALQVVTKARAKTLYHTNLANIGCVYLQRGEIAKAISYFQEALAVARELNDKISTAKWLRNIALAYTRFDNPELANRFYTAASEASQVVAEARSTIA